MQSHTGIIELLASLWFRCRAGDPGLDHKRVNARLGRAMGSGQRGNSKVRAHSASGDIRAETPVFAGWCREHAGDTLNLPRMSGHL